jgi:formate dehydrogenase major subunit
MGAGRTFNFDSSEEIWNEVRAVWKPGAGISYARLESQGLQWPCPEEAHPGTAILHTDSFAHGKRTALRRIAFTPSPECTDAQYPFLLTTGRTLYQFNAGTMTMRTPNAILRAADTLDISPGDAADFGFAADERVRVRSRHGETILPVRIVSGTTPGELLATFHPENSGLNQLTSPHRDSLVFTPEYKVVAVTLEKLAPHA